MHPSFWVYMHLCQDMPPALNCLLVSGMHICLLLQVMVANIRCGEILNDQLRALQEDQAWTSLVAAAQQHLLPDFGSQASNLLESCLTGK